MCIWHAGCRNIHQSRSNVYFSIRRLQRLHLQDHLRPANRTAAAKITKECWHKLSETVSESSSLRTCVGWYAHVGWRLILTGVCVDPVSWQVKTDIWCIRSGIVAATLTLNTELRTPSLFTAPDLYKVQLRDCAFKMLQTTDQACLVLTEHAGTRQYELYIHVMALHSAVSKWSNIMAGRLYFT